MEDGEEAARHKRRPATATSAAPTLANAKATSVATQFLSLGECRTLRRASRHGPPSQSAVSYKYFPMRDILMPPKTVPKNVSAKPSPPESKEYAEKAYAAYTSTIKWEDHQMAYYSNLRKWAEMNRKPLVPLPKEIKADNAEDLMRKADDKINMTFTHIRFLETTDPKSADNERLRLYVEITKAWINATDSLTRQERKDAELAVNAIRTFDGAEEFSRQLLSIHVLLNPVVDKSVAGASHYENLEAFVIGKYAGKKYDGSPQEWWFVHNVLYDSWAKDYERQNATPPPPMAPWAASKVQGDTANLDKATEALAVATKGMERMLQELKTAQEKMAATNEQNLKLQEELKETGAENKQLQAEMKKSNENAKALQEGLKKANDEARVRHEELQRLTATMTATQLALEGTKRDLGEATQSAKKLARELAEAKETLKASGIQNKFPGGQAPGSHTESQSCDRAGE